MRKDGECHHEKIARPGKRPAPFPATAGGSAPSSSSSTRGRKTDLASFRRTPAPAVKEELDDRGTKKGRPSPHVRVIVNLPFLSDLWRSVNLVVCRHTLQVAGRYGAVRRNR